MKKTLMFITGVTIALSLFGTALATISSNDIAEIADHNGIRTYSVTYIENGIPTTINSGEKEALVFEAGSLSKPVVAYICMELVKEGKISLDDTVAQYLDERWITSDTRFNSMTIRQLLSHTAGFSPSYEIGVDKKIYFEPGNYFSYSGVGYIYLQQAIETATGETLEQLSQQYVFKPLNMQNSTFAAVSTVTPFVHASSLVLYIVAVWCAISLAFFVLGLILGLITNFKLFSKRILFFASVVAGFIFELVLLAIIIPRMILPAVIFGMIGFLILWLTRKSRKLLFAAFLSFLFLCSVLGLTLPISLPVGPEIISRKPNAAYSLKSTSEDIASFANRLLSEYNDESSEISNMFEKQVTISDRDGWGLGIAIEEFNGMTTYWHSGINPGMQSLFVINPEKNMVVVIMTNSDDGLSFATAIARNILQTEGVWEIERVNLSQVK